MAINIAQHWLASYWRANLQSLSPIDRPLAEQIAADRGIDFDFSRLRLMEVDSLPEDQQYRVFGNVVAIRADDFYYAYRMGDENDPHEALFRQIIGDVLDRHQSRGALNEVVSGVSDAFSAVMKKRAFPRSFDTGASITSNPQPD